MEARGWPVTRTNYDFSREIYAWRQDVAGGPSPTLRMSQKVLEDYPAWALMHHLKELKVAQALRSRPDAPLVVVQNGPRVTLEEALG
jgi:hypothetical protein